MTQTDEVPQKTLLGNGDPIARGAVRDVWDRPGHPGQLLKTINADKQAKYAARTGLRRAVDDLRLGPYGTFRIEYRCYLQTAYACVRMDRPVPIAEIGGLVMTDRGLAQVCEKIVGTGGGLAPTLADLLRACAFDAQRVRWLNAFVANLYDLNVNVPDLRPTNVAFDEGRRQFILIDGYGDKTILPLRSWIRPLNVKQLDLRFAKVAVPGFLNWSADARQFTLVSD